MVKINPTKQTVMDLKRQRINFKEQKDKQRFFRSLMNSCLRKPLRRNFKNEEDLMSPHHVKFLRRATNKDLMHNGYFYEAVTPILVAGQCFGIMPVKGVKSKSAFGLSFSWTDFRTIYAIAVLFFETLYSLVVFYWAFSQTIAFQRIEPVIFQVSIIVASFGFILLARKWPSLMQKLESLEKRLPPEETQKQKSALAHQLKMIGIVVFTLSLTEHLLSIISQCHYANYCPSKEDRDPIRNFFRQHLAPLFSLVNYSPWWALIGKIINIYGTFAWNFVDLFVIVISVGISSRFKRINESLRKVKGKPVAEIFWAKHRSLYRSLCDICDDIDNAISLITMVSFSNNLYFICIQLLKSLNTMPSFAHGLYFWFSLVYLIGRTLAVSLYTAEINDEANRPAEVFRCVPRESWCTEVKRFSDEVNTDVVALTGMKFFHLTRKLVLSVAGTIVTYELVLIQFHEDEQIVSICELTL